MLTQLIPAGRKVCLNKGNNWQDYISSKYSDFNYVFTTSGTAALVYALNVLKKKRPGKTDVILPAYTCPDVLSAINSVDLVPVIVDMQTDKTNYNYVKLEQCVSQVTLAIIAIDLFGIPENYDVLKELKQKSDIYIIRDSAQCFPEDAKYFLGSADVITLSFGRGKPVTLLEGGMILFDKTIQHINNNQLNKLNRFLSVKYIIKTLLYNILIHRKIYWWIERFPFVQIGKTEYHEFTDDIVSFSASIKYLPVNVEAYHSTKSDIQMALIELIIKLDSNIIKLPFEVDKIIAAIKLNRLPVLIKDPVLREEIYKNLHRHGMGVSKMYPAALNNIPNIPDRNNDINYVAADKFAAEVLTLPVHEKVTNTDLLCMFNILSNCIKERLATSK